MGGVDNPLEESPGCLDQLPELGQNPNESAPFLKRKESPGCEIQWQLTMYSEMVGFR